MRRQRTSQFDLARRVGADTEKSYGRAGPKRDEAPPFGSASITSFA